MNPSTTGFIHQERYNWVESQENAANHAFAKSKAKETHILVRC